jgi:transposase
MELITGETRRRRWTAEEKARILADSFQPGAKVSEVALRHGVNRGLLWPWRPQARKHVVGGQPAFVPVRVVDAATAQAKSSAAEQHEGAALAASARPEDARGEQTTGSIDIDIGGARVRVRGAVDAAALRQVLTHLGRRLSTFRCDLAAHPGDRPTGRFSPRHGQPVYTGEGNTGHRSLRRRRVCLPGETRKVRFILPPYNQSPGSRTELSY